MAKPVKLHPVGQDLEPMLAADLFLQFLDLWVQKLNIYAAGCANHVVVVLAVELGLVFHPALSEIKLPCQPASAQVLQGAVNGGETHVRLFLLGLLEKLLGGDVARLVEKRGEDHFALDRQFKLLFLEIAAESLDLGTPFFDGIDQVISPFVISFHGREPLG